MQEVKAAYRDYTFLHTGLFSGHSNMHTNRTMKGYAAFYILPGALAQAQQECAGHGGILDISTTNGLTLAACVGIKNISKTACEKLNADNPVHQPNDAYVTGYNDVTRTCSYTPNGLYFVGNDLDNSECITGATRTDAYGNCYCPTGMGFVQTGQCMAY